VCSRLPRLKIAGVQTEDLRTRRDAKTKRERREEMDERGHLISSAAARRKAQKGSSGPGGSFSGLFGGLFGGLGSGNPRSASWCATLR
jgi:predicted lipid-binding transport protein (Tim44 family)